MSTEEIRENIAESVTFLLGKLAPAGCVEKDDRREKPQGTGRISINMTDQSSLEIKCEGEPNLLECGFCPFNKESGGITISLTSNKTS